MTARVIHGDCIAEMRAMADGCVDAIVTDPPYHLVSADKRDVRRASPSPAQRERIAAGGFMGMPWDGGDIAFRVEMWAEALRVLRPGGHLLSFGGARTYHRMACAIEDAGFEIRDCIMWITGSGFPKGLNVVNNLIKLALWQSRENVQLAAQSSASTLVRCDGEREHIAVALAQILPEGGLALLTEIGGVVGLHVPMATWPSEWATTIGLNTIWSWNGSLDEACNGVSKSITETTSETTIDRKIWNWLIGLHTSANTTLCSVTLPNGSPWPAVSVAGSSNGGGKNTNSTLIVTALGTATSNPVAKFKGFNVALKPAHEPIVVARKPLSEKTVAQNVLTHGCGALNIDASRVGTDEVGKARDDRREDRENWRIGGGSSGSGATSPLGRWPANVIHDNSPQVLDAFAEQGRRAGVHGSGAPRDVVRGGEYEASSYDLGRPRRMYRFDDSAADQSSPARFFYSAKASKSDRAGSKHPTVKPISLMRYLCKLVTPPGGTVLDMFCGTGTTLLAASMEGFDAVGIEQDAAYVADARKRLGLTFELEAAD